MRSLGIKNIALIIAIFPAVTVAFFLATYSLISQLQDIESVLTDRGFSMIRQLGRASEFGIITEDKKILDPIVNSVANEPDIRSIKILNQNHKVIAKAGQTTAQTTYNRNHFNEDGIFVIEDEKNNSKFFTSPIKKSIFVVDDLIEDELTDLSTLFPDDKDHLSTDDNKNIGYIVIEFDLERQLNRRNELLKNYIVITLIVLFIAIYISIKISKQVINPILMLTNTVKEVKEGTYRINIPADSDNELGQLASGIQDMALSIKGSQETLEKRVTNATDNYRVVLKQLEKERDIADDLRIKETEANKSKSKFLAIASHDLRQPLSALSLYTSVLLEKSPKDNEYHDLAININNSVDSLQDLFNKLLDISKLDAGAITPKFHDFSFDMLLTRLCNEFRPQIEAKGLELIENIDETITCSDQTLLETVIRNILSNACRYTEHGSIKVSVADNNDTFVLEITDTGIGIPDDSLNDIFKEFTQLHNPQRDRQQGIGLGLAIVERLCKLLNIKYYVSSKEYIGTTFRLMIPKGDPELVSSRKVSVSPTTSLLKDLKVLVIDDEQDILNAMTLLLSNWKCQVHTADSHEQALALIQTKIIIPDVIICDYRLPNHQKGVETLKAINEILHKDIPALIITGDTDAEILKKIKKSGYPVLHKPAKAQKLKSFLSSIQASAKT